MKVIAERDCVTIVAKMLNLERAVVLFVLPTIAHELKIYPLKNERNRIQLLLRSMVTVKYVGRLTHPAGMTIADGT